MTSRCKLCVCITMATNTWHMQPEAKLSYSNLIDRVANTTEPPTILVVHSSLAVTAFVSSCTLFSHSYLLFVQNPWLQTLRYFKFIIVYHHLNIVVLCSAGIISYPASRCILYIYRDNKFIIFSLIKMYGRSCITSSGSKHYWFECGSYYIFIHSKPDIHYWLVHDQLIKLWQI